MIVKTIREWQSFLEEYKQLRKNLGYSKMVEIRKALLVLKNTGKIISTLDFEVINLFRKYHITDIDEVIGLLEKLNSYLDFQIFKEPMVLKEKYGIDEIALILGEDSPIEDVYLGFQEHKIAFFPKGFYPWWQIDLKKGKMTFKLLPWAYYQFIIAEVKGEPKRTLYTSTLQFVSETLPTKEEMGQVDIDSMRLAWFDWILYYLMIEKRAGEVDLEIVELDEHVIEALITKEAFKIVLTDGDKLGGENRYKDTFIKQANFVWEIIVDNGKIISAKLMVDPLFLAKYQSWLSYYHDKSKKDLLEQLKGRVRRREKENF